ncbi:hypothetical protein [Absidia glauca]|uniref:Uncharacterized protein n=1 Tax=Absidia glauca TaxID=4829 RepID=A0A168RN12_ABSGL|nr:hypothetical protein [Absidia glauca]
MVSQSSILFLLAFATVAVSARPLDRRAPMDPPGQTAQTTDKTQANFKTLNEVLACTSDKMKMPKIALDATAEPGQSPLPWVDAFKSCIEMFYPKSGKAQDPAASGQDAPDQNTSTDEETSRHSEAARRPPYGPGGRFGKGGPLHNSGPSGQDGIDGYTPPGEQTFAGGAK